MSDKLYQSLDFTDTERFYRVPKIFLLNPKFNDLSNEAKLCYAVFRDKHELSCKNKGKWVDKNGDTYFYFSIKEMQELFNRSHTYVIKIKKELQKFNLIREVSQGLNKANRIYLVDIESKQYLDGEGIQLYGTPQNGIHEVNGMESNDTEYSDTERNIKDAIKDTQVNLENTFQESFIFFYDRQFLTEKTVQLFLNFGNTIQAKIFLDIIFKSKKKVENYQNKETKSESSIKSRVYGDIWSKEIENQAIKFLFKMKEYQTKDKPIDNLESYWFKSMQNFWESVLLMEKRYGVTYLIEQYRNNQLELDMELIEYSKGLSLSKEKNAREAIFKAVYHV
ncbi:replication initiator protein A [Brochothrix thermosphacta]|uniref:replication initiator protein A n=1 Tax=Brochothrix thermosphacta TaxID=2756 RepID=UPI0039AFEE56